MMELLQSLRGSGLLANPVYYASLAGGLAALALLFRRAAPKPLIWAAAIALSALIGVFVFLFSVPPDPFQDFTRAYWGAGQGVLSGWEGLKPHYERGVGGFVNLPILAYLFAPFALLQPQAAALVFLAIGLAAIVYAVWKLAQLYGFDFRTRVFALFLIAGFGPLVYSIREANTTHILLAPLVLAVAALRAGKDLRAGALIGAAALLKPLLLLIGVIAVLRGRIRLALGGFVVVAGAAALSLAVFGWSAHAHWYEESIRPFSGAPLSAFNSQSIASSLARAERGPADYWSLEVAPLGLAFQVALYAIYAALGGAFVWAARPWMQWRADTARFEGELMLALMLALLASTLAWTHYFALALLPAAWLWREIGHGARREKLALALAYVLAAPIVFYGVRMGEGQFGWGFYVLGSHVCVAALILYALLARARRALPGAPA